MKKLLLAITLIISIVNISFAQNATKLNEGNSAPFSGVLLKESTFNDLVRADKKVITLEEINKLSDEEIDRLKGDNKALQDEITTSKFTNSIKVYGAFLLGLGTSILAFKTLEK